MSHEESRPSGMERCIQGRRCAWLLSLSRSWVIVVGITGIINIDGMLAFAADLWVCVLAPTLLPKIPQLGLVARCWAG